MTKIDLSQLIEETRKEIYKMDANCGTIGAIVMNPDSNTERYLKAKFKEFTDYGHEVNVVRMSNDATLKENIIALDELMQVCQAVLVQEPHPFSDELNEYITHYNKERGEKYHCYDIEKYGDYDPTSQSVVEILDYLGASGDETIAVLGAGMFGRNIVNALMKEKFSVISCNSRTQEYEMLRNIADYTVLAFGKGELEPIYNEKIIDVSFNISHDDTIKYDYTPLVGGTGKMTTLCLLKKFNEIMLIKDDSYWRLND